MTPTRIRTVNPAAVYLALALAAGGVLFFTGRLGVESANLLWIGIGAAPALVFIGLGRCRFRSVLILLLFLVLALGRHAAHRIPSPGEGGAERALAEAEEIALQALAARADSLQRWTHEIAADKNVAALVRDESRRGRLELFRLLEERGGAIAARPAGRELALEVYGDGGSEPVAWWGEVPDLEERGERGWMRLASDPFRVHLLVESPVRMPGRRAPGGLVRAVLPIGPNPELAGRATRPVAFAAELRELTGGEVVFHPDAERSDRPLQASEGTEIGGLNVRLPSREERVARIRDRGDRAGATLLFLLAAATLPWRHRKRAGAADRGRGPIRDRVARIPVGPVIGLRLLSLLFDLPGRWLPGSLSGPESFASGIGLGLFRSPSDLLLTAAALFAVLLVLRERTVSVLASSPRETSRRPAALAAVLLVLSGAAIGFGLLLREITFSTTLPLFDGPNPIGPPPVMILELSLFLLGAAYLLLVDGGFSAGGRLGRRATGLALPLRVLLGLLSAAAVLLLTRAQIGGGPLYLVAPATAAATGLLVLFLLRGRGWRVWSGFGFVIAVAIVSYPHLSAARDEAMRLRLEEKARGFADPRDEWKRFLLEETMRFFAEDEELAGKLSADPAPPMDREAFLAWVRSGLSRFDYSTEVRVLDRQGAVVSRFALDMPAESPVRAAFVFRDIRASGGPRVYEERRRLAGESVEIYTGAVPLFAEDRLIGAVVVSIPYYYESLEQAGRQERSSEILRAGESASAPRRDQGEFQVVLYRGGKCPAPRATGFRSRRTSPMRSAKRSSGGGARGERSPSRAGGTEPSSRRGRTRNGRASSHSPRRSGDGRNTLSRSSTLCSFISSSPSLSSFFPSPPFCSSPGGGPAGGAVSNRPSRTSWCSPSCSWRSSPRFFSAARGGA
ncbi:MAG: hypothetical protein ABIK65_06120 [Candidatus Eisenbacteria bacterium]